MLKSKAHAYSVALYTLKMFGLLTETEEDDERIASSDQTS